MTSRGIFERFEVAYVFEEIYELRGELHKKQE
jgi:hypothetical protein